MILLRICHYPQAWKIKIDLVIYACCNQKITSSNCKIFIPIKTCVYSLLALVSTLLSQDAFSTSPRTPSQALPEMFRKPSAIDYYEMKRQEAIIPKIPEINIIQQEDTGITIETLILAPIELQNIIPIEDIKKK